MEIEGSDGSKTRLKPNSNTVFGRGNGFHSNDLSVSRRHIYFDFNPSPNTQTAPRVSFEVLGKNPVWIFNKHHKKGSFEAFKRFQRGELGIDDLFCVSPKTPIWFTLKKVEEKECKNEEIKRRISDDLSLKLENVSGFNSDEDSGLNSVDVDGVDPVKEFGFLVIGHEFDQYPKKMIRMIKDWDWFLDDPRGDSDDDDDFKQKGMGGERRKRKKSSSRGDDDVDEEWTAESEGDEITTNARKVQRPKYSTRSKGQGVSDKGTTDRKSSTKTSRKEDEEESEDEEDETLGGFVVNDDSVEEGEMDEDEDEEEEFTDDEDELE